MPEQDPNYHHTKIPTESEKSLILDPDILRQANADCVDRTRALVKMLGVCRQQFSLYAESHRSKNTDEGNQKAETNSALAKQIDEVLKEFRERTPSDVGPTTE